MLDTALVEDLAKRISAVKREIGKVIVGQHDVVDQLLISLFARGHCLLVGVPGLAKTLLVRTLAESLHLTYSRVQFTPDLMPGDITGTEVIEDNRSTGQKSFRFVKGPVFANIVLADEINRTPPKTQAALLEAMQEHSVTAAGTTYHLEEPFFVLATQNPIEQEGTYPLPEAQLDRFMFNLRLDYPSYSEEVDVVRSTTSGTNAKVEKVMDAADIIAFQDLVRRIPVADNVVEHAVKLVRSTRPVADSPKIVKDFVGYGAGPRASQYLVLGAKSRAALTGRFTPSIEDVNSVAASVLRHRLVTNFSAEAEGVSSDRIVEELIRSI
ncbi:MAG: AAA family ATPase [Ignavibacteria bacterium]|nr:AAA family ATPase [Ignavibacteria bacterium]MBK6419524.1 AAA family ATPase [Ignavibacteria bacterium]MBK6759852.1 AAA family ATPase [Ignavibacteria bacterium]MBK7184735.1 AAA family ATPase [Ignavibacteria bacterium]MBK7413537.1 AAA family ATPase [Ignavibacteria bacterium]